MKTSSAVSVNCPHAEERVTILQISELIARVREAYQNELRTLTDESRCWVFQASLYLTMRIPPAICVHDDPTAGPIERALGFLIISMTTKQIG